MIIYAHRGFSGFYPENTMISFQKAYDVGVSALELDVQMTKDEEIVVIHDERVDRTTNGIGYVRDFSLNELKKLDAGSWFNPLFEGESVPTLKEVLKWLSRVERKMTVNIEIKNNGFAPQKIETKILDIVNSFDIIHQLVFSSFSLDSLNNLRELDRNLSLALLIEWNNNYSVEDIVYLARDMGVKYVHIDVNVLKYEELDVLSNNTNVCVYTVNDKKIYEMAKSKGVYGVFTDFPNKIV
ncbi:glycerophosphodiester phosphodiesterase family protein [Geobacillus stearothermophilus]|nr:glycerophosphodiester phosphodiesterase family protein [Geobacillus stearothermophilus]